MYKVHSLAATLVRLETLLLKAAISLSTAAHCDTDFEKLAFAVSSLVERSENNEMKVLWYDKFVVGGNGIPL